MAHGQSGFLAPVGDVDAMADYVLQILKSDEQFKKYSANAASIASDKFHFESTVSQYESLYERAIQS